MKFFTAALLLLTSTFAQAENTPANCPGMRLKEFHGQFKGVLSPVNFNGERQALENMIETHTVRSCTNFDADVRYFNPETGKETRSLQFAGQWDETKKGFILRGALINGILYPIRPGQYLVTFETKFGSNPAHCEEMIIVSNNATQVVRSVHCFAGNANGPSLGVRTILGTRVTK